MPYITKNRRDQIARGLTVHGPGELTYQLQQVINDFLSDFGVEYRTIAECLGALEGCKADFIDQVLLPYEAKKRKENGTVWTI